MAFLLDHLPPQLHLVIATRADPPLPLARLRARGELVELRAADLRFTPDEAAAFLNEVMGLDLSAQDIAALEERTEGWIAGLQLAALSMQGREDVAGFIAGVRRRRPLHRGLSGRRGPAASARTCPQLPAADLHPRPVERPAVRCRHRPGRTARRMLEALERGNLFVVPLDDRRQWYRYHHLFADVLRAHLLDEQPERRRRRCTGARARGTSSNGERPRRSATRWPPRISRERRTWSSWHVPAMRRSRQEATLLGWLKALPDELLRCRPVLSVAYAGALLASGELEGVEARLRDAERWLDTTADMRARPDALSAGMVVVDEEEFRRLPGSIAVHRAGHALALGDVAEHRELRPAGARPRP